ncbi:phosphopantetheine binding protein [Micromonospora sp. M71_S20]|uniref:acyl carrier protein n=1 Tax=Micromonospora sp. M71_S20 TaxID=592872 RepID=UPI000F29DB20|nr:acyl carrier protein [Micromonospora sp. M71_S20]RLK09771.1 phosphopantetheine binding protein [Micromonospora sp. M71_S20]
MSNATQNPPQHLVDEVRAVWEKVLGHADFGDEDPFFEVAGGNSLTAVQVMVELTDRVGNRLPMRLILRNRTVVALAAAIGAEAAR